MSNDTRPRVSIIVAVTNDNAIGRDGDLVFRLRPDMRHFRRVTIGHAVVMGRKTWETLPEGGLPGRRNIVITRNAEYEAEGAEVVGSLDEALALAGKAEEVFVIGGAQIYAQALPLADRLYLTRIDATVPDADTWFPAIGDDWRPCDPAENGCRPEDKDCCAEWQTDPDTQLRYRFVCLSRK